MRKLALVLGICLVLATSASADVLREIWNGSRGIDAAIALAESGTPADQVDILAEPTWADIADNYSARMSGWLAVPEAGEYTFYVAGDDYQRLYLSEDGNPANAELVAYVDGWTASQDWAKYDTQKAEPMTLAEGQIVYLVGIMQEGGGGDGQDWGWIAPGTEEITVIPGELFSTEHPTKAAVVAPADGVAGVVDVVAEWTAPGQVEAPVYNVYGGTDPEALDLLVEGITETTLPYGSAGAELDFETTYYWRVDVVGQEEGFVWSFTTQTGKPIISSITGAAVAPGADAQLVVEASSLAEGELSYQWYRARVEMMGIVLEDVPLPEGVAAVLNVSSVTIGDEGEYYCVVSNALGETRSANVWLDVQVGLIHRWTFDESPDGVTIPDIVGGADATLMNGTGNATIADGQATLANDGSQNSNNAAAGDYIDLPNGLISPLTQMTLECWTTWDGTSNVWQRVFDMGTSDGGEDVSPSGNATTWFCWCPLNGGNVVQIEYRKLGASTNMPINDNGPMTAGEEVMVTLVHDDVAGIVKAYINGTIISGMNAPVTLKEFIDNNIWLGRSQWGDPLYCGSFNELRWYDTARTAAEIAADYLAGPDVIVEPAAPCDVHVAGDRNDDCVVDFVDAAITADEWLVRSLED